MGTYLTSLGRYTKRYHMHPLVFHVSSPLLFVVWGLLIFAILTPRNDIHIAHVCTVIVRTV